MYVNELKDEDIQFIIDLDGEKTIQELSDILGLENKSTQNLRKYLDLRGIKYKLVHKAWKDIDIKPIEIKNRKLELTIGKYYKIQEDSEDIDKEKFYEGLITEEYDSFYLGMSKSGYRFTVHKYPNCYIISEL